MDVFDFANASFTKANDGKWTLDRDWAKHPPTQNEIEVLFAHCLQLDRLLAPVLDYFFAGFIHTADALPNATREEVARWLVAVRSIMGPPRSLPAEATQMASLGLAE